MTQRVWRRDIDISLAKKLLDYDPETGVFLWKGPRDRWGKGPSGLEAGCKARWYRVIKLGPYQVMAHRLAFLWVHGWAPEHIDHIDGDGFNNAISNLRACQHHQNLRNQKRRVSSKTGFKGVTYRWNDGKVYEANITIDGKLVYLGRFKTSEAAHAAYLCAAKVHFGEFARAK